MPRSPLAAFAASAGLTYAETASLPAAGATLTRAGGKVVGAAAGKLPGGIDGTLAHFTYTHESTDSDGHTSTEIRNFTLVVTRIPESIGFLPYFGFAWPKSKLEATAGGTNMAPIHLDNRQGFEGAQARAYAGVSEHWLAQLLSPALVQWLSRSETDFGFELADGVLVCGRTGYKDQATELTAICEDAAHLAKAIREECLEEADSGTTRAAAVDPDLADPRREAALAEVGIGSPAHLGDAEAAFRSHARRSAETIWPALKKAILIVLLFNIPGAALPIVFLSEGFYVALAVIELGGVGVAFYFFFRGAVRGNARGDAEEAFFRAYAGARGLRLEEPLRFAAEHAEAKLQFKPDRVLTGPLPGGGEGSLILCGDGSKRSDRIAVVTGPSGPIAEAGLESESPGLSTKDLDLYLGQLAGEAREDAATAPTTA